MDGVIENTAGLDTVMAVDVEEPAVVIPGDAAQYKDQRVQLAEIPIIPAIKVDVEAVMADAEAEVGNAKASGDGEGMDDLFG